MRTRKALTPRHHRASMNVRVVVVDERVGALHLVCARKQNHILAARGPQVSMKSAELFSFLLLTFSKATSE